MSFLVGFSKCADESLGCACGPSGPGDSCIANPVSLLVELCVAIGRVPSYGSCYAATSDSPLEVALLLDLNLCWDAAGAICSS